MLVFILVRYHKYDIDFRQNTNLNNLPSFQGSLQQKQKLGKPTQYLK